MVHLILAENSLNMTFLLEVTDNPHYAEAQARALFATGNWHRTTVLNIEHFSLPHPVRLPATPPGIFHSIEEETVE